MKEWEKAARRRIQENHTKEARDVGAAALALDAKIKELIAGYNELANMVMRHPDKQRMRQDFDAVGNLIAETVKARKHLRQIVQTARGL